MPETKKYLVLYALVVDGTQTFPRNPDRLMTDAGSGEKGKYDLFQCTRPVALTGDPQIDPFCAVEPAIECLKAAVVAHLSKP